jgi:O-antigen biosynthesis protein
MAYYCHLAVSTLSVIIVNYNVKHFIEQCISSVLAASTQISTQIIVVDNASADDSVAYLQAQFGNKIELIANQQNVGFAKANNQALALATGTYILYLNPDTLVGEDCFTKCIAQMEANKNIGALGVHLIDGTGNYLPESKRGFPSFETAFYKITGINKLFSQSQRFNKYYMGHVPEFTSSVVDTLVGCFMLMPTSLAKQVGGFDEDYFMYGEDIDLSYKVQKAGKDNYYYADVSVIHFKGESTKKGSINYVKMFYEAMIIFAKKHLTNDGKSAYIPLIKLAIAARAVLSLLTRLLGKIFLPIVDALLMLFVLLQTKNYWLTYIKPDTVYTGSLIAFFFTAYILIWVLCLFLNGAYDKPLQKNKVLQGMLIGAVITVAIYGLVPEQQRFSRGITVVGASLSALLLWLLRWLISFRHQKSNTNLGKQMLTVSSTAEQQSSILSILQKLHLQQDVIGNVSADNVLRQSDLGVFNDLQKVLKVQNVQEVIFANKDLGYARMIETMRTLGSSCRYKMYAEGATSIIGSNSKNTAGDLYALDEHFAIATAAGRRSKRTFDVLSAIFLLLLFPILFWISKHKKAYLKVVLILLGKLTWCTYANEQLVSKLPRIKNGVLPIVESVGLTENNLHMLNVRYARNYNFLLDFKCVVKALF